MKRSRSRAFLVLALTSLAVSGCPVNPATGERQLILISESDEIAMGLQGAKQVEATIGLYQNAALQEYVSEIGKKLAAGSEKPGLPWSFKVVDDPIVNAFALPGGYIYVTRGILAHFDSEAELAGVLGHEIGHVTARHSAEQLSRAQVAQLGVGVGSVFVPEIAAASDFLGLGLGLMFLRFGRDDERQADDLGLRYMRRQGYDPNEIVDVFDMLNRVSGGERGGGLPGWLSTHPDPGERAERMQRAIAEAGGTSTGEVGRDRYLRQIDGLVYGENPRNGFFRGSAFMHPDLKFQLVFPDGWQTQNLPQVVAALSQDKDALIQLSIAEESDVNEAASKFFSQSGVRAGSMSSAPINGLPARWGYFSATTQQGNELRGLAAFVEHESRVYQILGYTTAQRMSSYESTFRRTITSFDRLTDPEALNVQPRRIELVKLDRAMSLEEFTTRNPSTVDIKVVGLLNGLNEGETIPAGRVVKRVVGGTMPEN